MMVFNHFSYSGAGHHIRRNQQGIALLQVLLISAVISVLALYFTMTARQQVSLAQQVDDRVNAMLQVKSAESQVLFQLLTRQSSTNPEYALPSEYNFYGVPFTIGEHVEVQIQDTSGLISVKVPDRILLRNTLLELNLEQNLADTIVDSLIDWQDRDDLTRLNGAESSDYVRGPRNRKISTKNEIRLIRGMTDPVADKLLPLLTNGTTSYFNPKLAPATLLEAYMAVDADDILTVRQQGRLTNSEFRRLSGIQEREGLVFSASDTFEIRIRAQYGRARIEKLRVVKVNPYAKDGRPFIDNIESVWQ